MSEYRWKATIYYLTNSGLCDVEHNFDELDLLHHLVEAGPSFQSIDRIEVIYTGLTQKLTVEEADAL